jgi:hypothetical protein
MDRDRKDLLGQLLLTGVFAKRRGPSPLAPSRGTSVTDRKRNT